MEWGAKSGIRRQVEVKICPGVNSRSYIRSIWDVRRNRREKVVWASLISYAREVLAALLCGGSVTTGAFLETHSAKSKSGCVRLTPSATENAKTWDSRLYTTHWPKMQGAQQSHSTLESGFQVPLLAF